MTNDSSTGGYVIPSSSAPAFGSDLDDIFHDMIVGITGLDPTLVRPNFQTVVPDWPEPNTNWCSFQVSDLDPYQTSEINHNSSGQGSDTNHRIYHLELMATFYGPDSMANVTLFQDGISIPQNNEIIRSLGLTMSSLKNMMRSPMLQNLQWIDKWDSRVKFVYETNRTYPILNILSAPVQLDNDVGEPSQNFTVTGS